MRCHSTLRRKAALCQVNSRSRDLALLLVALASLAPTAAGVGWPPSARAARSVAGEHLGDHVSSESMEGLLHIGAVFG